ncbi:Ku protein [Streptomyces sp. CT34]|uniref:non-homologous end joining protein Ku n=1 Tax=Streptomyces sp. CT34 TaxID=1553907 RepID=UPI0005BD35E4|nr:Ku protein [Streptomyces sp. CT34]
MRSIWNGSISFGLVTIPVKTYSATDRTSSVSFVRIHEKDGAPVQYRKVCELDGEEVPNEEIGKGYQPPGDETVVPITDDDLSRLPLPTAKTLAILSFVDPGEIDPLQLDKSYYLAPNGAAAAKPYALLREALEHHRKVAIGKVAMRGRENLAMLRAYEGALVMHALLWPDQIRSADGVAPEDVKVRETELTLAETLMDSLGELDPAELHDDYRQAVEELVAAKLEGTAPAAPDTSGTAGAQVIDLTAALEKSVRAARGGGGGTGSASVTPLRARGTAAEKAPAKKKATARKAPAKTAGKSAAKSGTTQRTARERTAAKKSAPAKRSAKQTASTGRTSTAKAATSGTAAESTTKSTAKKPGRKAPA